MSDQSQSLADRLENEYPASPGLQCDAAAELRRLDEEVELQKALVAEAQEMAIKLAGANQELLEALQAWLPGAEAMGWNTDRARAAISKHGGHQ